MKKFSFRLDSVLRYRSTQLDIERARLSQMLAAEERLKQDLAKLIQERQQAVTSVHQARELQALDLRSLSAYLVGATAQENLLRNQIAHRAPAIAQQRARVIEAERNVRLLQKLRTKRLSEWQRGVDRELDTTAEEAWLAAHFN